MNKTPFIGISIILSYILIFLFPFAWLGIIASIPLFILKKRDSAIAGFLIGFIAPLSIYIIYPFTDVIKLSNIIGSIVGLPEFLILIIYPLFYGIIMAISALIYSGIYEKRNFS